MKAKGEGLGSGHSALVGRDQPTLISPPEQVGNRNFAFCLLPWGSALRGQWEKSSWGPPAAGKGIRWGWGEVLKAGCCCSPACLPLPLRARQVVHRDD